VFNLQDTPNQPNPIPTPTQPHQGDTTPESDPSRYLQSLHQLMAWYWQCAPGVAGGAWPPLVINTHGWVAGLGLELLVELLRAAEPTHGALLYMGGVLLLGGGCIRKHAVVI